MRSLTATLLPAISLAVAASAQSNVDATSKWAWAENVGWLNWHDAGGPAGAQGVRLHNTFLSGFIWAENAGWINVGDGSPESGIAYANVDSRDFGVNCSASGELYGMAWGENIGWINFAGGAAATPPLPAQLSENGCRLRGFAWGENIGWINLDDATRFVRFAAGVCDSACPGDVDGDNDVDLTDLATLLANFGTPTGADPEDGDLDGDGDVDLSDLSLLLANFGSICT